MVTDEALIEQIGEFWLVARSHKISSNWGQETHYIPTVLGCFDGPGAEQTAIRLKDAYDKAVRDANDRAG